MKIEKANICRTQLKILHLNLKFAVRMLYSIVGKLHFQNFGSTHVEVSFN